jgi:hypothetical protein
VKERVKIFVSFSEDCMNIVIILRQVIAKYLIGTMNKLKKNWTKLVRSVGKIRD